MASPIFIATWASGRRQYALRTGKRRARLGAEPTNFWKTRCFGDVFEAGGKSAPHLYVSPAPDADSPLVTSLLKTAEFERLRLGTENRCSRCSDGSTWRDLVRPDPINDPSPPVSIWAPSRSFACPGAITDLSSRLSGHVTNPEIANVVYQPCIRIALVRRRRGIYMTPDRDFFRGVSNPRAPQSKETKRTKS